MPISELLLLMVVSVPAGAEIDALLGKTQAEKGVSPVEVERIELKFQLVVQSMKI